jgi:hypothetical protein
MQYVRHHDAVERTVGERQTARILHTVDSGDREYIARDQPWHRLPQESATGTQFQDGLAN